MIISHIFARYQITEIIYQISLILPFPYLADFLKTNPNEMCSHLSEKASKSRFLKPENLQNHSNQGKGKEKKKEQEEGKEEKEKKKSNGCTLSFYNSYFG